MAGNVFEGVSYYLSEKNVHEPAEVKQLMRQGGAVREFYMSDLVTHLITDSPLEPSVAANPDITIVHSDWVKMSMKCEAMLPTAPFELRNDKLFSGLVFCSSKLSRSDVEKVCVLVAYYGGKMQRRLDATVTHLVTMETTGAKYECAVKHSDTVKIVTPDWLLDCIDLGKRVTEDDYCPSPAPPTARDGEITGRRESHEEVALSKCNGQMDTSVQVNQADKQETVVPCTPGEGSVVTYRHPTAELPSIEALVSSDLPEDSNGGSGAEGGVVVPSAKEEVFEVQEEEGSEVNMTEGQLEGAGAGQLKLRVRLKSQETCVVHEIARESVTSPSTDTSEQPHLLGDHLTSVFEGTPTTAGPEQSRLLEGMSLLFTDYQKCMDKETIRKWKEVVIQHGGRVLEEYDPEQCTHLLALHKKSDVFAKAFADGKCVASAHWLNDILTDRKMYPPRHALHFPTAFKWQLPGAENYSITLTNYTDTERELVKDMIRITGIPYTGFLCRETTHLVSKRAVGKKYNKALEWGVQVVNASFLTDTIHNGQVPAVLFPRHTVLGCPDEFAPNTCPEAASLLKPWELFMLRYSELHPQEVDTLSPHRAMPHKRGRGEGTGDVGEMKKLKVSSDDTGLEESQSEQVAERRPPVVLFTGISQSAVKKLKTIVQRLGGVVTDKARECTHMVATRVTRTVKFLSGISVCDHVVTPEWVEQSGKGVRFVKEGAFALCDRKTEEMFGMDLASSLARAKGKKLLKGFCLHSTPHVQPPHNSFKEIIECAGGELLTQSDVNCRFGEQFENLSSSTVQFIVISCPEDANSGQCSEFFQHNIAVYNAEFVLTGILRQELNFSQNKILQEKILTE